MANPHRFTARLLVFGLLLALPILRMLLYEEYGLLHIEVGVVLILAGALAACFAAVTRSAFLFYSITGVIVFLLSVNAVSTDFFPHVRLRWIIAGLLIALAVSISVLRANFYKILVVFLVGSFLGDIAKAQFRRAPRTIGAAKPPTSEKYNHVVHIILDEMAAPSAMPPECKSCREARTDLENTFQRGNFRLYPYSFSNYRSTRDSIPSILNNRLIQRTGEYFPEGGRPFLHENRYFDAYRARNYDIRVYQSDYLLFSAPRYSSAVARTYKSNSLKPLHALDIGWAGRLRQMLIIYLQADHFWWSIWTRALPAALHFERIPVGPLAFGDLWPEGILSDIRSAKKNTLFLAHILTPHYPYIYRPDGSLRPSREWRSHLQRVFYDSDITSYRERYELYGEQVQLLNSQIASFLDSLRASGNYDATTIVFHGDHGSRLRLLKSSERAIQARLAIDTPYCPAVSRYDYVSEPDQQDLLNRFSTLLAVKMPNARLPEIVNDEGSVMFFLRQASLLGNDASADEDINSVYLFDENGRPRAIPIRTFWRTPVENGSGG